MNSKEIQKIIEENLRRTYSNPDSILKKYKDFLLFNGIYSINEKSLKKIDKQKDELISGMLTIYQEAKIRQEKYIILDDLYKIGYSKDKLVEMILDEYNTAQDLLFLWQFGDLLYTFKRQKFLSQYISIIMNPKYGTSRQMIVLLVGKSKKEKVIPYLKELLNDPDVHGHALEALANFVNEDIISIMKQYTDYKVTWIRKVAVKYLKKHNETK